MDFLYVVRLRISSLCLSVCVCVVVVVVAAAAVFVVIIVVVAYLDFCASFMVHGGTASSPETYSSSV